EVNGITIINDTTSTTPTAGIKALESFPEKKIILVTGGNSKNLPLEDFLDVIRKRAKALVYLKGNGTDAVKTALADSDMPFAGPFESMEETVSAALGFADSGDTIVFSPSFTSYGQFRNEFERGEVFTHAAHKATATHRKKEDTRSR
ncbi:MAG: hypothetical protein NUV98_01525, partial [Candidatus Roizmanbacteria bacterium]|nr:hypothetical protein [Candidatus Roizmanbacteria bacterium]